MEALKAEALKIANDYEFPLPGTEGGLTDDDLITARKDPKELLALMTSWAAGKEYDALCASLIMSIFPELEWQADRLFNIWTTVKPKKGQKANKDVCFMAHMDTVQRTGVAMLQRVYQVEDYRKGERDFLKLDEKHKEYAKAHCLGADDRTGCAIIMSMMHAGVAGRYVFFHGEEGGRIGSQHFELNQGVWMDGVKKAIQFDRRGYESIISSQSGTVCASDEFVKALAKGLNDLMPEDMRDFRKDPSGSFTDTHSFTHRVAECTNISSGYHSAHSKSERQDVDFYLALTKAAIELDWEALPVKRVPVPKTQYNNYGYNTSGYGHSGRNGAGAKKELDAMAESNLDACMKDLLIDALLTRQSRARLADLLLEAGVLYYIVNELQD